MEIGDTIWAIVWFVTGLFTFQVTSLKNTLNVISGIITAVSIIALVFKPDELIQFIAKYISNYPISYISGTITNLVYLIGANLARGDQFHEEVEWDNIIFYGIAIAVLVIVFYSNSPIVSSQ